MPFYSPTFWLSLKQAYCVSSGWQKNKNQTTWETEDTDYQETFCIACNLTKLFYFTQLPPSPWLTSLWRKLQWSSYSWKTRLVNTKPFETIQAQLKDLMLPILLLPWRQFGCSYSTFKDSQKYYTISTTVVWQAQPSLLTVTVINILEHRGGKKKRKKKQAVEKNKGNYKKRLAYCFHNKIPIGRININHPFHQQRDCTLLYDRRELTQYLSNLLVKA